MRRPYSSRGLSVATCSGPTFDDSHAEWRLASGRPGEDALVFPAAGGETWSQAAYQSWRRRAFARALKAAGVAKARPYDYADVLVMPMSGRKSLRIGLIAA